MIKLIVVFALPAQHEGSPAGELHSGLGVGTAGPGRHWHGGPCATQGEVALCCSSVRRWVWPVRRWAGIMHRTGI